MQVVRGRLDNRQAIVNIGVERFRVDYGSDTPTAINSLPIAAYRALVDTGAQRTCLTYRTIAAERLVRHGKKYIANVHNENVHSLFMARLGFWCSDAEQRDPQDTRGSYYGLGDPVEVINIADNERFDAIIGMDILTKFDFTFSKNGDFCIELR